MKRVHASLAGIVLFSLAISPGCVSFERSYPDRRYFVIETAANAAGPSTASDEVLLLAALRISPRYADRSFIYRTSEAAYEADFYHQFLSSPETMIAEELRKSLAAAQRFKHVIGPATSLQPNYILEGSVNALYGDFRNLSAPQAVMEIEFFLYREDPARPGLVMQKRFLKSLPIGARSPEALVKGWGRALEAIVADFQSHLQKLNP